MPKTVTLADLVGASPEEQLSIMSEDPSVEPASTKPEKAESVIPVRPPKRGSNAADKAVSEAADAAIPTDIFKSVKGLDKSEQKFYAKRRASFIEDLNLNASSDLAMVHQAVMEEIIMERLYAQMVEDPEKSATFQNAIDASSERYRKTLDSLGASRDKRIKNKDTKSKSVADYAKMFFEDDSYQNSIELEKWAAEDAVVEQEQGAYFDLECGSVQDGVVAAGSEEEV